MSDCGAWLRRIGADELRGWLSLADADPWFGRENELHAWGYARVWAAVSNLMRTKDSGPPALAADLVRDFGYDVPHAPAQTAEQREAAILSGGAATAEPDWLTG